MPKKNENVKETEEEKNTGTEKKKTTKSSTAKKTTSTKKANNKKNADTKVSTSKKNAKKSTTEKTSTGDSKIQTNSRLADLMTTIETKEVKSNKSKKTDPKIVEEKAKTKKATKTTKAVVKTEKTENVKVKKDESKDKNTKKAKSKKETTKKAGSVVEKNKNVKKNKATADNKISTKKENKDKNISKTIKPEEKKVDNVSLQVSQEDILEGIKEEVKKRKEIPTDERKKIKKDMLKSFLSAIFIIVYFGFIILGYKNIELQVFFTDLRIFSIVMVVISIMVFEEAYKKNNVETCLIGIELMVSAVITLIAMYIFLKMRNMFVTVLSIIIGGYAVYYIVKLLILYKRLKNSYYKKSNDIRKIIKEDEDE